ncbi:hypothetical protein RAC89_04305 [Paenibacillus sp. GD4]|uniref:hypothetical protein n=1 Tax=Paenibacillus sp. GD4 TaxID=3068890 RepID=UPI0027964627|nr:hypothetical protein [Paenibacillus sp. GD4]MDQ1909728.1 hypothetical protein [Paenibacillus sp. GD4]
MMTTRYDEVEVHIYQLNNYRRDHWGVYSGEPVTDPARFHLAHTSKRLQRPGCSAHEVLEALWADIHTWSRFHADIALQYVGVDLLASDVVVVRNVAYLRKAEGWQRLDWDEFLARTSPSKDRLIMVG